MKMFLSDNNSGVHQQVLTAMVNANKEHDFPYGNDHWSQLIKEEFCKLFGQSVDVYFVATGTAANVIGISSALRSFEGVICAETAHINEDECGAFEKFTGAKILTVPHKEGKVKIEDMKKYLPSIGFIHQNQPRVISISQTTEFGTLYTLDEIKAIADFAHDHNMYLHVDGARIANAAVALNKTFKEMITDTGVDLLSFGGTKNGMMFGEAIIVLNPSLGEPLKYIRKQGMNLISKMRYIAAGYLGYLKGGLWHDNAKNANEMAFLLAKEVEDIEEVELVQKVESNIIFAKLPLKWINALKDTYGFYVIDESEQLVRWVTSFDTKRKEILKFADAIRQCKALES